MVPHKRKKIESHWLISLKDDSGGGNASFIENGGAGESKINQTSYLIFLSFHTHPHPHTKRALTKGGGNVA